MSLYNMMHGVKPSTFLILPMLGKHPDEYPRFRDCFIGDSERPETEGKIIVYTRTGGGNREDYEEENRAISEMPGYLFDYDDDFDCTFANFVFDVPPKWKADFDKIMAAEVPTVSDEYVSHVESIYPTIADKLRSVFRPEPSATPAP